jgi:two-component system NtrC family sensor kinase
MGEVETTELGELARAFDLMRLRLRDAMGELEEARRGLERKVEERGLQLLGAKKRLAEADRLASLGRLAGVVAHEINNPIAAVRTFSEGMQRMVTEKGIPPERVEEFRGHLAQVSRESARVGRIVQDLLSFARRGKPQIVPTDLNSVVLRTLSLLRHKLDLGRVAVETRLAEALAGDGGGVLFEVEDRGLGIPVENQRLVFEPFFTTKETARGVGLGLSVVLGIVQNHGGSVEFDSVPGRGTTFRVLLPLKGGAA